MVSTGFCGNRPSDTVFYLRPSSSFPTSASPNGKPPPPDADLAPKLRIEILEDLTLEGDRGSGSFGQGLGRRVKNQIKDLIFSAPSSPLTSLPRTLDPPPRFGTSRISILSLGTRSSSGVGCFPFGGAEVGKLDEGRR